MAVKVTVRSRKGAVNLRNSAGEFLAYAVKAAGAIPTFTLACQDRVIKQSDQFLGHPKQDYLWTVTQFDSAPNTPDTHTMSFMFVAATKYTLQIEQRDSTNTLIDILQDLDFESSDPNDRHHEPLMVVLK
jgi:hypothetical protein